MKKAINQRRIFIKSFSQYLLWICIPTLVISSITLILANHLFTQYSTSFSAQSLQRVEQYFEKIENYCSTLEDISSQDSYSGYSLKSILQYNTLSYVNAVRLSVFNAGINALVNNEPSVESAYIFWPNQDGRLFESNRGIVLPDMMLDSAWKAACPADFAALPQRTWYAKRLLSISGSHSLPVLTVYRKIASLDYQTSQGLIAVHYRLSDIQTFLKEQIFFSDQTICVFDANGEFLVGSNANFDANALQATLAGKEYPKQFSIWRIDDYTVAAQQLSDTPLLAVSYIPNDQLYLVPRQLMTAAILLVGTAFILSIVLAARYSAYTAAEIQHILDLFDSAQRGRKLPELPKVKDERSYIVNQLISTFIQQEYLKVQLSEKNHRARAMELMALQAQINPHFLFNTMDTIKFRALALTGRPNDVSALLENLSSILRYTLNEPQRLVPLSQEIDYAKAYLEIQSVRFRDSFQVNWQYETETEEFLIPKLILQPLIENAIQHGIRPAGRACILSIHIGTSCRDTVEIQIKDNGIGMSREQLEHIKKTLQQDDMSGEHIGLRNTAKRLLLLYGDHAEIKIDSKENVGTSVTLLVPKQISQHTEPLRQDNA